MEKQGKQIKITETATLKVLPDTTVVSLTVKAKDAGYDQAVQLAGIYLEELCDTLVESGVLRDDIKTENLNVKPVYEQVQTASGGYKQVVIGYQCYHALTLEFGCDAEFLSNILSALTKLDSMPEVSVAFKLSNVKDAEEELIGLLADKAANKARLLCKASGVKLGELVTMEYDSCIFNESFGAPHMLAVCRSNEEPAFSANLVPREITVRDTAVFVWELI